jgi:beta-glucosidase
MDPSFIRADYNDPRHPIESRVDDLLKRMSLEEKQAQLGGAWGKLLVKDGLICKDACASIAHGIGHITRNSLHKVPFDAARDANALQAWLHDQTRLGIPALIHEETCAGVMAREATAFPMPIGMAASFDPDLIEDIGAVIRQQMLAVGAHQALAPVLDVVRDHRWGRCEETFGEDSYLAARCGVGYVLGVQGPPNGPLAACTAKHFVGYSASAGGLNWAPAQLGERELRDHHLPPFAAVIAEAGVRSVMNAYQEIDGIPVASSREILTGMLRDELGFSGVVVSDYDAIKSLRTYHDVAIDDSSAACLALRAGIDLELPVLDCYGEPLRRAVASGAASIQDIDEAVRRVLRLKFELGLFEHRRVDEHRAAQAYETKEHRELAHLAALRSLVLVRNEGRVLPLKASIRRIALIGPSADSVRLMQGDYQYPSFFEFQFGPLDGRTPRFTGTGNTDAAAVAGGATPGEASQTSAHPDLAAQFPNTITVKAGLLGLLGADISMIHERGCDIDGSDMSGFKRACDVAASADVVIAVLGGRSGLARDCTDGEFNDRATLGLPGVQQQLLEALVATGRPVILVLICGRPLCLAWAAENVPGILYAWLPGEEGGTAIAQCLLGSHEPQGRLPVSLARAVGQMPVHYNHKPSAARSYPFGDYTDLPVAPLYPFGHGMGYSRFTYSDLSLSGATFPTDGSFTVRLVVTNVGSRSGTEVVQLYLRARRECITRPVRELRGIARIALSPGDAGEVEFSVDASAVAAHDRDAVPCVVPGEVEVQIGASSADIRLRGLITATGARRIVQIRDWRPCSVRIGTSIR